MKVSFLKQHITPLQVDSHSLELNLLHFDTDSRNIIHYSPSCFIAIKGSKTDGHLFIQEMYNKGVRCFIIQQETFPIEDYPLASFFLLPTPYLPKLQEIARAWRKELSKTKFLAITGSNGKTTVKEWIKKLLSQKDRSFYAAPLSYNSQLGVALSILSIQKEHQIAIIEAGVSEKGEMIQLQKMIQPQLGLFTYFGDAHNAGFSSMEEKWEEKTLLFKDCERSFYPYKYASHYPLTPNAATFGNDENADLIFELTEHILSYTCQVKTPKSGRITLNESHVLHYENIKSCIAALLLLELDPRDFNYSSLEMLKMRQEILKGRNGSTLINDSYNADFSGIHYALQIFFRQFKQQNLIIISEWENKSENASHQAKKILELTHDFGNTKVLWLSKEKVDLPGILHFADKISLLNYLEAHPHLWSNKHIFIKGSRRWQLEDLVKQLSLKKNVSSLEVNLTSLEHNINEYQQSLSPETEIMAIVKANAYGIQLEELVPSLEIMGLKNFAVANVDEAVALRKIGVKGRIISLQNYLFDLKELHKYQIEPSIYSFPLLEQIAQESTQFQLPITLHIKFDTGMGRLGFEPEDWKKIHAILQDHPYLHLDSVFTHLPSADDPNQDALSMHQFQMIKEIQNHFTWSGMPCKVHISNSAGIERFENKGFDYARLGIGMFGIATDTSFQKKLKNVLTLNSYVVQIKKINAGQFISYGRTYESKEEELIITIPLGYADGIPRALSNGKGTVNINGINYPIVGKVTMDFTMVSAPLDSQIKIGDEVQFFGPSKSLKEFAENADTIPYEILTHIAPRIKRVYTNG